MNLKLTLFVLIAQRKWLQKSCYTRRDNVTSSQINRGWLLHVILDFFLREYHGGESRDILHIYSDRAGKHIRHYFIKAE